MNDHAATAASRRHNSAQRTRRALSKARLEREGITFKQTPYAIRTK